MATKTAPAGARFRRTPQTHGSTGRFQRATPSRGRHTPVMSHQRPALRMPSTMRARKSRSQGGIRGLLERLPAKMRSSSKSRRSASLSSKAKPGMAIAAAAAGALLGRRRMQQRRTGEPERTGTF